MSTAHPSRRALLTGAAGLAVGAGADELARATLVPRHDDGPYVASPGEELMTEHGVLRRLLLAYRAAHDGVLAGRTVDATAVLDAAQIISDYVESFHEGLEEGYVFPRVARHEPELIRTLLIQHDRGRHLTAAIQAIATAGLRPERNRTALTTRLAAYVRMYEPHEAWEDTVVYPRLRDSTPQRTLDELAERFADLENRQYGDSALATLLQRVTGIEQRLGIADLASFTPSDEPWTG